MAKKHKYRRGNPRYKEIVGTRRSQWRRFKLVRLSEAQGHRCAYCCGETYIGADCPKDMTTCQRATLEHLIPQSSDEQTNKDENLVMACSKCNLLRGCVDPMQFYNRLRHYFTPKILKIKKMTPEKIAKQKVKEGRAFALCCIAVYFWPEAAATFAENYVPRVSRAQYRRTGPVQINELALQVTSDPLRMAA